MAAAGNAIFTLERIEKLGEREFELFSKLIYEKTGIFLKPEKRELLNARLAKRLRALGLSSFRDYYDLVVNDPGGNELVQLIDAVSTNFTSFFREPAHFDLLRETILPAMAGRRPLRFWSAACSSGEEPYTLAMVVDDFFRRQGERADFIVQATDISTRVLAMAEKGVYPEERVRTVPQELLRRYFQKGVGRSAGLVRVKDELKRFVRFSRFNLMEQFRWQEPFEVIFCRNVMIYFNRETQERLVGKFYRALAPGGYLIIGHSESISRLRHDFVQVGATAYRR